MVLRGRAEWCNIPNELYDAYFRASMVKKGKDFHSDELEILEDVASLFREEDEHDSSTSLLEWIENSERPYGHSNIEESIAFRLGWDPLRLLTKRNLPEWVGKKALSVHYRLIRKLKEDEAKAS